MSTHTVVSHLPDCDLCKSQANATVQARFDGLLGLPGKGTWAYVCVQHFLDLEMHLGTGQGQLLLIAGEDPVTTVLNLVRDRT